MEKFHFKLTETRDEDIAASQCEVYIAAPFMQALLDDFRVTINYFIGMNTFSFSAFRDAWVRTEMSVIHYSCPIKLEIEVFTQLMFSAVLYLMENPSEEFRSQYQSRPSNLTEFVWFIGVHYSLYTLYYTQKNSRKVPIRLTIYQFWRFLLNIDTVSYVSEVDGLHSIVLMWQRMLSDQAFVLVSDDLYNLANVKQAQAASEQTSTSFDLTSEDLDVAMRTCVLRQTTQSSFTAFNSYAEAIKGSLASSQSNLRSTSSTTSSSDSPTLLHPPLTVYLSRRLLPLIYHSFQTQLDGGRSLELALYIEFFNLRSTLADSSTGSLDLAQYRASLAKRKELQLISNKYEYLNSPVYNLWDLLRHDYRRGTSTGAATTAESYQRPSRVSEYLAMQKMLQAQSALSSYEQYLSADDAKSPEMNALDQIQEHSSIMHARDEQQSRQTATFAVVKSRMLRRAAAEAKREVKFLKTVSKFREQTGKRQQSNQSSRGKSSQKLDNDTLLRSGGDAERYGKVHTQMASENGDETFPTITATCAIKTDDCQQPTSLLVLRQKTTRKNSAFRPTRKFALVATSSLTSSQPTAMPQSSYLTSTAEPSLCARLESETSKLNSQPQTITNLNLGGLGDAFANFLNQTIPVLPTTTHEYIESVHQNFETVGHELDREIDQLQLFSEPIADKKRKSAKSNSRPTKVTKDRKRDQLTTSKVSEKDQNDEEALFTGLFSTSNNSSRAHRTLTSTPTEMPVVTASSTVSTKFSKITQKLKRKTSSDADDPYETLLELESVTNIILDEREAVNVDKLILERNDQFTNDVLSCQKVEPLTRRGKRGRDNEPPTNTMASKPTMLTSRRTPYKKSGASTKSPLIELLRASGLSITQSGKLNENTCEVAVPPSSVTFNAIVPVLTDRRNVYDDSLVALTPKESVLSALEIIEGI